MYVWGLRSLSNSNRDTSCLVSDPRVPSERTVIFAFRSYPGSKLSFLLPSLSTPLSSVRTPYHMIALQKQFGALANPVNTVIPAVSTFSPSHFTNRLIEIA